MSKVGKGKMGGRTAAQGRAPRRGSATRETAAQTARIDADASYF